MLFRSTTAVPCSPELGSALQATDIPSYQGLAARVWLPGRNQGRDRSATSHLVAGHCSGAPEVRLARMCWSRVASAMREDDPGRRLIATYQWTAILNRRLS